MTVTKPIETYVPHRGAMLLLDRLVEHSEAHAVAEVTVPKQGLFVREGAVPAWVGIEYMAQTISAWAGARSLEQGKKAKIGFLLGSRRYETKQSGFPVGLALRIEVRCELIGQNGLGAFDCRILSRDEELAHARVTVFEPADESELMQQLQKKNTHG